MFQSGGRNGRGDIKKFTLILVGCVVAVLGISLLAILIKYDFDIKTAMGGDSLTETQDATQESEAAQISADKTYFFWVSDSDDKRMRFAWLVNIRLPEREISVCTLEISNHVEIDGTSMSIEEVYLKYGKNRLVSVLEAETGIKIDGYIGSNDESFKSMINYPGGIDITVPEQIEYRGDEFTLILVKGRQNLKGDTLLKYLRYLDTLGEKGDSYQASVILEAFEYIFKPSFSEKRERIYSNISNTLVTNITIVDFSAAQDAVELLMENGFKAKRIADTPQELKK